MNLESTPLKINHLHASPVQWNLGIIVSVNDVALAMTPRKIIQAVAYHARVSVGEILGDRRQRAVVRPRQIAMLIVREACPEMSFPDIALQFNRDHTTVLHGLIAARKAVRHDGPWRQVYLQACQTIGFDPLRLLREESPMKWTDAEDEILRRAWTEGKSCKEIGKMVGRSPKAAAARRKMLGLPPRQKHAEGAGKALGGVVPLQSMTPYAEPERPRGGCQWPYSDPGARDFHFCGAPILPNQAAPYCREHLKRAYTKRPAGEAV